MEIVKREGYPAEYHEVVSEDGYILVMHRIPYSPKSPAAPNRPVVFLQHGIMDSSYSWVALGPKISIGIENEYIKIFSVSRHLYVFSIVSF